MTQHHRAQVYAHTKKFTFRDASGKLHRKHTPLNIYGRSINRRPPCATHMNDHIFAFHATAM